MKVACRLSSCSNYVWMLVLLMVVSAATTNNNSPMVAPLFVGEIQHLFNSDNGVVGSGIQSGMYAARVRLPWVLTTMLGDYFHATGIGKYWKKLLEADESMQYPNMTHVATTDGGRWQLLPSNDTLSNFYYLYAHDQETHNRLLSMLGFAEMDSILQSIGQEWGADGITIYSMGFMGATRAEPGAGSTLRSHVQPSGKTSNMPRAGQLLIPLYLKGGSRPELHVEVPTAQTNNVATTIKLKQEMDVGVLFGDAIKYGPGQFDYRDSPDEVFMVFAMHFWIHMDTDSKPTTERPSSASSLPIPAFSMEWLQNNFDSSVRHWKRDDASASLFNLQGKGQVCSFTMDESAGEQEEKCVEQASELIFWTHPDTYNWSQWTFHQFQENLECHQFFDEIDGNAISRGRSKSEPARRQPPSQETWVKLRALYTSIVGTNQSTLSPDENENSFYVDVITKASIPGRGRGVFANQFIPKGTLVYTPRQQARFTDGYLYKKFVMSVSVDLSCDLLAWMSIQKVVVDNVEQPPQIIVDLDDGALVNGGSRPKLGGTNTMFEDEVDIAEAEEGQEIANVGCIPDRAGCSENDYALMDILAGEELLIDYAEYSVYDTQAWISYGLSDPDDETDDSDDG